MGHTALVVYGSWFSCLTVQNLFLPRIQNNLVKSKTFFLIVHGNRVDTCISPSISPICWNSLILFWYKLKGKHLWFDVDHEETTYADVGTGDGPVGVLCYRPTYAIGYTEYTVGLLFESSQEPKTRHCFWIQVPTRCILVLRFFGSPMGVRSNLPLLI